MAKKLTARAVAAGLAVAAVGVTAAVVALTWGPPSGQRPIRFAYQNRVGSAACIVAVEKGLFTAEGLAVEAFRFHSGPACAEALYSGSADIGTMGDTTALITVSRGTPFAIIASHACGEHRHRLVVGEGSPLRSADELAGKTVAVKKGTSTYGGFLALLASKGLDASRLRVVDMRPGEMPAALAAGSLDAFVASEPTPSLAEVRGARELVTLGGLGNSYPVLILARRDLLADRADDVRRFLRALRRAMQFIRRRPDETAEILARATGLPPEVARRALARHRYTLALDDETLASLAKTARFLKREHIIDKLPDLPSAIEAGHLAATAEQAPAPDSAE